MSPVQDFSPQIAVASSPTQTLLTAWQSPQTVRKQILTIYQSFQGHGNPSIEVLQRQFSAPSSAPWQKSAKDAPNHTKSEHRNDNNDDRQILILLDGGNYINNLYNPTTTSKLISTGDTHWVHLLASSVPMTKTLLLLRNRSGQVLFLTDNWRLSHAIRPAPEFLARRPSQGMGGLPFLMELGLLLLDAEKQKVQKSENLK